MKNSILTLICSLFLTFTFAQKKVYLPEYKGYLKNGTYEIKSFSKKFLKEKLPIIKPNIETLNSEQYLHFLNPSDKEIVLFENHNLIELKPIGKLIELTQVYVDSVIHKYKYKDLTNCVWNRISINDNYYYTDADIHDFTITKGLNKLNQKLNVIGQYAGYDGAYHLGYPEHFFLIFTDHQNKVIYKTKILDFYLNDEFAMEEDILNLKWNETNSSYTITLIGADEKVSLRWNGKETLIK